MKNSSLLPLVVCLTAAAQIQYVGPRDELRRVGTPYPFTRGPAQERNAGREPGAQPGSFAFRLGSTGADYGKDVAVDALGNSYVAAYFSGTVDFDPGPGEALRTASGSGPAAVDIALAKYDPQGNFLWVATMGSPGADIPHSVTLDSTGNVYLAGYFSGTIDIDPGTGVRTLTSAGGRDVFLAEFTPTGTLQWAISFGGSQDDEAMDVAVDGDGNVSIVGIFNGAVDLDPGPGTRRIENSRGIGSFVASYDNQGLFRWGRALSSLDDDPTLGGGIGVDAAGNVVICTTFSESVQLDDQAFRSAGQNDLMLAKFSRAGSLLWAGTAGGPGMDMATPGNLAVDAEGAIYITGNFEQTATVGSGAATRQITSSGGDDAYLAKYDSSGVLLWRSSMGGASGDSGHKVAADPPGFVLLTGWFRGTANLAPRNESPRNFTSKGTGGANDAFTAKYRSDTGAFVWAQPFGAPVNGATNITLGGGVAADGLGQVTVTGRFAGAVTPVLTSAGDSDIFVLRYTANGELAVAPSSPVLLGVANAAGGRAGILSPNAYYSLFGSDLGTRQGLVSVYDGAGQERTGVVVYTSPGQVNFRTPQDQPLGAAVIKYVRDDGAVATLNATTESADPGIFAIVFGAGANTGQRVTTERPARPADILSIYATGLGADSASTVVQMGSARVLPSYAGEAPGFAGLNQVNFTVPADLAAGPVSVTLVVGGRTSNAIGIVIAGSTQAATLPSRIGGPGTDYAKDVVVDSGGNIVLVGYFESTVDFDPGPDVAIRTSNGAVDTFIAKFDKPGRLLWVVSFGSPGVDIPHSVTVDRSGNILVTGYFSATCDFDPGSGTSLRTSRGARDVYLLKLDPEGRFLWVVTFGGPDDDQGYNLKTDPAGNVYVTGFFGGRVDLSGGQGRGEVSSNGDSDAFVASYDADGGFRWGFSLGGPGAELGTGVALDRLGNVMLTGSFSGTIDADPGPDSKPLTSAGASDVYLAKYDGSGKYIWAVRFGGPQQDSAIPGGIWIDWDHIYVTGNFNGTADFDPGPAVASRTSAGSSDVYVAHYDAQGNYVDVFTFGGPGSDNGHRLTVDSAGAIYVTGWFTGTADFDPGPGTHNMTAAGANGANDAYLAKFDARGRLLWVHGLGGAPSSGVDNQGIGTAVYPDGGGNVIAVGRFFGTLSIAGAGPFSSAGSSDMYLARFGPDGELVTIANGPASLQP